MDTLINGLPITPTKQVGGDGPCAVSTITDDSREVTAGCLFVLRDTTPDKTKQYLQQAIEQKAAAILTATDVANLIALPDHVSGYTCDRVDQALAGQLAERFFDQPARQLKLVGITGTNGKTSVALIVQHLLKNAGLTVGLMGTIWIDDGQTRSPADLTTPGAIAISRALANMVAQGCTAAVLEVSSHALSQGRTAALNFDVAVFTNLTGDHLDYHDTMENYAAAKAKLFESLAPEGVAVVNMDDAYADRMLRDCHASVLRCTLDDTQTSCDATANIRSLGAAVSDVRFDFSHGAYDVKLPLIGRHNVANALYAAVAANCVTPMQNSIAKSLTNCPAAPGRLEPVVRDLALREKNFRGDNFPGPTVLVDYAHTHDALANVLRALRPLTSRDGKLRVLFGCGGDRDKTKRPRMANVACELADDVMITSDNPRTENPDAIITDILTGVTDAMQHKVTVEPDRAKAINAIIQTANQNDVVLLAGKGHEDYQIIGHTKHPFDDRLCAKTALENCT